jgi:hypothetical protein
MDPWNVCVCVCVCVCTYVHMHVFVRTGSSYGKRNHDIKYLCMSQFDVCGNFIWWVLYLAYMLICFSREDIVSEWVSEWHMQAGSKMPDIIVHRI